MTDPLLATIGVAGAGTMGSGIALLAALHGHSVMLWEPHEDALTKARARIGASLTKLVERGELSAADAERVRHSITTTYFLDEIASASIVIEAIVEDIGAKRELFMKLEGVASPTTILATNTSSLSVTALASACKDPGRFLGVHFFNPATKIPLVEVIPTIHTSEATVAKVQSLLHYWRKSIVIARDTPGFIVNRVARPFYGEALRILDEGLANVPTIDWAMKELAQFKMGPFELMDLIGNDVNFAVSSGVFQDLFYDARYRPSLIQRRMVEAGFLGKKCGRGFYDYSAGMYHSEHAVRDATLGEAIANRIVTMLINEAAEVVQFRIASPEEIDRAMVLGVSYPKGLLEWGDEIGAAVVYERLNHLYEEYREERYRPSAYLRRIARLGGSLRGGD